MVANGFIRGHRVYYNDELGFWYYTDGKRVYDNDCKDCVKCGKHPIDDVDFCLYGLRDCDFINSACCGHGVEQGYIMLKDGRRFVLEQNSEKRYCKNCKNLGLDGMFGIICDVNGNNKNYDCPKYEEME